MAKRSSQTPWDILARCLSTREGLLAVRLEECLDPRPSEPRVARDDDETPRAIGPWLPRTIEERLAFVREPSLDLDAVWWRPIFSQDVLYPKAPQGPCRAILIGESAAAGMFLTPNLSPALALERHLAAHGRAKYEVIDLTRNSMNAGMLVEVARASLQLLPDWIVIFAGNNWFAGQGWRAVDDAAERMALAEPLLERGPAGIIEAFRARVRQTARATVDRLGDLVRGTGSRLLLVVPPVNLLWERQEPVAWLGSGRTPRWFEKYGAAVEALRASDYAAAHALGLEMIALDSGACATSHRIVANACLGLGRLDEARAACQAELDSVNCWDTYTPIPGASSDVADEIRSGAERLSVPCVDLPKIFEAYAGSPFSWGELFLDYCHYTPKGTHLATAPIAAEILIVMEPGGEARAHDWRTLARHAAGFSSDTPKVEAVARFHAGLYAVHHERPVVQAVETGALEVVLERSIAVWKDVLGVMESYVRARNGALSDLPLLSRAGMNHAFSANSVLDAAVVSTIRSIDARAIHALAVTLEHHGAPGCALEAAYLEHYRRLLDRGVDLADPVYQEHSEGWASRWRSTVEWGTWRTAPYVRALWPSSRFFFAACAEDVLDMEITARLPSISSSRRGEARICLNGEELGRIPIEARWSRSLLQVEPGRIVPGFNCVTADWPPLEPEDDAAIARAHERYLLGQAADLFPVFAEVFSWRVKRQRPGPLP
jgi:hypothetical protein